MTIVVRGARDLYWTLGLFALDLGLGGAVSLAHISAQTCSSHEPRRPALQARRHRTAGAVHPRKRRRRRSHLAPPARAGVTLDPAARRSPWLRGQCAARPRGL